MIRIFIKKQIEVLFYGKFMNKQSVFFEKCLKHQKIRSFSRGKILAPKEINLAKADLDRGVKTFKEGDFKWATIQAYYSMFHSARALLYYRNYREKSHACLIEAIRIFYVQEGKIGYWLIETMQEAKRLREEADYYGEYSESTARNLISKADEFLSKAKELIVEL